MSFFVAQSRNSLQKAQPRGLFADEIRPRVNSFEPRLFTRVMDLGDLAQLDGLPPSVAGRHVSSGTELDADLACHLAEVEGLERYSAIVSAAGDALHASANDLRCDALDLDCLPRCSANERAHPKCQVKLPDKRQSIRWVPGVALDDGRDVFIPGVLVYLTPREANETFWLPTSTGCAAHTSYDAAILNALLEVIERDALTLIWLHQLPVPRIEIDVVPQALEPYWKRYLQSDKELEYLFFDATTDLGIPIIYGVQRAHSSRRIRTLVSCSCGFNAGYVMAKVIRDMSAIRIAFRQPRIVPASWDDFSRVFDGAVYMAEAERESAFAFLLNSEKRRLLSRLDDQGYSSASPKEALRLLLERLRARAIQAYVVDLTTDEARHMGVYVVRVVVPALQPLSFHYRARYLAHRRLYAAPTAMGYEARSEETINSWPQPFA
jgi:ribosomal protein S12 methylthiotransferase accessory factor